MRLGRRSSPERPARLHRDSSSAGRLPARYAAFNVTEAAALQTLDDEGLALDVVERITQQVIRLKAHQHWIKQPLHPANGCNGAANMLKPHEVRHAVIGLPVLHRTEKAQDCG